MEFPNELKNVIETEASKYKINELKDISEEITRKYKHESGESKRLVTSEKDVITYATVRMPATYAAISKVINSFLEYYDGEIKTVLDIGAGVGTASFVIENLIPSIESYELIEREENMINFGKKLSEAIKMEEKTTWKSININQFSFEKQYDLVIASYSLNELNDKERNNIIKKTWEHTKKVLIIIEPGTQEGFYQIRKEREYLIQEGAKIIAPCTTEKECPIEENNWCHFTCRVQRSKLHKQIKEADVPYEDEKFSYIVCSKSECNKAKVRVLRHPIIESGKITLETCSNGTINQIIITKKRKELFKKARKINAGESFDELKD